MVHTSTGLAATLRAHMDELERLAEHVDERRLQARTSAGAWSVAETLSHLQGADGDTFLDGIQRIIREDQPAIDVQQGQTHWNADRRAASASTLLSAVLSQYRAIADTIDGAAGETMGRRAHIELLADSPFGSTPTLEQWTRAIVEMHVAGHMEELRGQLAPYVQHNVRT